MKKLKPQTVDWAQIERFVASAEKKLASAHKILAFDEEACLQQAYEAMLKASLGFMFSHGFRARSQPGHHIAIIDFPDGRETSLWPDDDQASSPSMTPSKRSKLPAITSPSWCAARHHHAKTLTSGGADQVLLCTNW